MAMKGKVASFAHLLGISAKKAEDDDKKDYEKDENQMEEDDEKDKKKDAKKKADDGDDEDAKAEDQDSDGEDEENLKKKAKGKADKENEEDDDLDDKKEKAIRNAERARCRAIFTSKSAGIRPDMAAHLAFETDLDVHAAVGLLEVSAQGHNPRQSLSARMAEIDLPKIGTAGGKEPDPKSPQGIAAMIVEARKKRRGEV